MAGETSEKAKTADEIEKSAAAKKDLEIAEEIGIRAARRDAQEIRERRMKRKKHRKDADDAE